MRIVILLYSKYAMSSLISLPASCHFICRSKRTYCSTLKSNYSQTNYSHTLWIGTTEYKLSFSESLTCFSLRFIFFSDFFSMFDQYVQRPRKNKVDVSVWVSFCKYSNVQYCATRIRTSNHNRGAHSQERMKKCYSLNAPYLRKKGNNDKDEIKMI